VNRQRKPDDKTLDAILFKILFNIFVRDATKEIRAQAKPFAAFITLLSS
jgi:hypothetical protein